MIFNLLKLFETNRHAPVADARAARRGFWIANASDPDEDADEDSTKEGDADKDAATIYLYDVFSEWWGLSARDIAPAIAAITAKTLNVRINSPGGDVFEARAIKTALEQHPARVVAHVDGWAASAASFVMLAADEILIARGAMVMIHNAQGFAIGDAREMRATAELLDKVTATVADDYVAKTGIASAEIRRMMDEETWMMADEAVAKKFCDRVMEKAAKATDLARFDLSAYARPPRAAEDARAQLDHERMQASACEAAREKHRRIAALLAREPA